MKTLYIISKGIDKLPEEEIIKLEKQRRHPRVTLLQEALNADLLDERYLYEQAPKSRRWLYKKMSVEMAQIIEALFIHRKYDVVFTQSERVGLPLAFMMKYLNMKTPHVLIVSRITSMDEDKSRKKMRLLKATHSAINRILIWSSVQRKIAIEKLGVPPEKITLIKRGTDQRFWQSEPAIQDMICSVGMEMRDYPTLVEALRPLDIPCHIAAGKARGQLFDTVRKLYDIDEVPEHISIGSKTQVELRELYNRCKFVVVSLLPTDSDNGLTAILEAMAMGKAVICSRVDGQVDVIQEGETGIFVPQGDPVAMREAIVDLWNNPEKAERMGKAGRKYIERNHTLDQFVIDIKKEVVDSIQEVNTREVYQQEQVKVEV